jgi:hypothetical protein
VWTGAPQPDLEVREAPILGSYCVPGTALYVRGLAYQRGEHADTRPMEQGDPRSFCCGRGDGRCPWHKQAGWKRNGRMHRIRKTCRSRSNLIKMRISKSQYLISRQYRIFKIQNRRYCANRSFRFEHWIFDIGNCLGFRYSILGIWHYPKRPVIYCSVFSSFGAVNIWSVFPNSTSWPSSMKPA